MAVRGLFVRWLGAGIIGWSILVGASFATVIAVLDEWRPVIPALLDDGKPVLWGPLFGQQTSAFKFRQIARQRPPIVVLGSSRGTQFRADMFPGASIYNASLVANSLGSSLAFLETIVAVYNPKLVILPIDTWWFNPGSDDACIAFGCAIETGFRISETVAAGARVLQTSGVFQEVTGSLRAGAWRTKVAADPIGSRLPVGYLAQRASEGFRPDGSFQYGRMVLGDYSTAWQRAEWANTDSYRQFLRRLEPEAAGWKGNRFGTSRHLPADRIETLDKILSLARRRGIEMIVLLPPFSPFLLAALDQHPHQKDYFDRVTATVSQLAMKHTVAMLDAHRFDLGKGDFHFYDALHADEHVHLAIVRMMAATPPLNRMLDLRKLDGLSSQAASRGTYGIWRHLIAR